MNKLKKIICRYKGHDVAYSTPHRYSNNTWSVIAMCRRCKTTKVLECEIYSNDVTLIKFLSAFRLNKFKNDNPDNREIDYA